MKELMLYEAMGFVEEELLAECLEPAPKVKKIPWRQWGALAACLAFAVGGALYLPSLAEEPRSTVYPASEPSPSISAGDQVIPPDEGKVSASQGDDRELTLSEARELEGLGDCLPAEGPQGFRTESVRYREDEGISSLSVIWTRGEGNFDELDWRVFPQNETTVRRITPVAETQNYDLSLYPIPLADSVPEELWEVVDCPIFPLEELTREAVERRVFSTGETEDPGDRMRFGVLRGDLVVEVSAKGVSPQWLYEALIGLRV